MNVGCKLLYSLNTIRDDAKDVAMVFWMRELFFFPLVKFDDIPVLVSSDLAVIGADLRNWGRLLLRVGVN